MTEAGRRETLFKFVLIALIVIFGGAFAEAATRVYAQASDSWVARHLRADPFAILVEAHGEFGYRPRPSRTIRYENGATATSNAQGFRGPEVAADKPAGTIRVILLGGSTTHGWGVDDDETIDHYMRAELEQRCAGRSLEVINLAYDGYDSYQLFERLRSDGLPLDPDFVIVNTGVNDVRNARYPDLQDRDPRTMLWLSEVDRSRDERMRGGPRLWTRIKHYFFLARIPAMTSAAIEDRAQQAAPELEPYSDAMDYFQKNLVRITELVRDSGTTVLLSSEPSALRTKYQPHDRSDISYWIRDAATTQSYRDSLDARLQWVVERAQARGERVARVPHQTLDPSLFLDDAHLGAEGNRRVAQAFVRALDPLLSCARGHSP
jgi:lysophospholipase L1-like esterase